MSTSMHQSYPCPADVETTFAALSSEEWAHAKDAQLKDGSTVVRREEKADGGVVLQISRNLPDGVPGFLERFLPKDGKAGQTDDWGPAQPDGSRRGQWTADIPGAPAQVSGTMSLTPAGDGSCTYTIDGTVKVKVPVIGGKAEKFIADMVGKLTAKEAVVLRGMVS